MMLVNSDYGINIEFEEGLPISLVIENKSSMSDIVNDLWLQSHGKEGKFILSDKKELKIDKLIEVIVNPFDIDFNNKKIINTLYTRLLNTAHDYVVETEEINSMIINRLDNIINTEIYSGIDYNLEFDWKDIFKIYNVRIDTEYSSFLEKICEYIKLLVDLCDIHILVFVNINAYLNLKEIEELIKVANYHKAQLIFLEAQEYEMTIPLKTYIIDKDKCLIFK